MLLSCKWHQTAKSQLLLNAAGLFGLMDRLVTDLFPLAVWTQRAQIRKMPLLTHPYGQSRDNLHPSGSTSAFTVISYIDLIFSFLRARKDSSSGSSVRKYLGFFFLSVAPPPPKCACKNNTTVAMKGNREKELCQYTKTKKTI